MCAENAVAKVLPFATLSSMIPWGFSTAVVDFLTLHW